MPEAYPTYLAGQRITAALLRSGQIQSLRKTADTPRSATTTQTADPHLQIDVAVGAVYTIWGWLKYDALAAADVVIGWSFPSGTLGEWSGVGPGITVTSATAGGGTQQDAVSTWGYTVRDETTDLPATRTYGGLGVGNSLTILVNATVRVGSTPGTLALTWAQNASNATATTVYTDSWLNVLRTA